MAAEPTEANEQEAERIRTRVRLLIQLTTRHGRYRRGRTSTGALIARRTPSAHHVGASLNFAARS